MASSRFLLLLVALSFVLTVRESTAAPAGDIEFFEKQVRPLLIRRCYRCHSKNSKPIKGGLRLDTRQGARRGGDSGPAVVPGQPDASLLIKAIRYGGVVEMPPKSKLAKKEIAILTRWVRIGAPWPNQRSVVAGSPSGKFPLAERRRQQWCWQPIRNPKLPGIRDSWSDSAIDRFVSARMKSHGLRPTVAAGRAAWLRRVSFDLIGLPPTPQELLSFLADKSPTAHEMVVDRLLASPRYGEHWARRWMDLVRYAETKGFEGDYTMPYVFRYRDYLIRGFNSDVPYNQFVVEHVAGDLVKKARRNPADGSLESPLGGGYLYLNDGHHGPPDIHADEVRVFENLIDVTSKTFLAQTLACARCHDHKFDPITTRDYYSLYGILASSRIHFVNSVSPDLLTQHRRRLSQQQEKVRQELARIWLAQMQLFRSQVIKAKSLQPLQKSAAWKRFVSKASSHPLPLHPARQLLQARGSDLSRRWVYLAGLTPDKPPTNLGGLSHLTFGKWLAAGNGFGSKPVRSGEFVIAPSGKKVVRALIRGPAAGYLSSRIDGSIRSPMFQLGKSVSVRVKGRHARVRLYVQHYELVGQGVTTRNTDPKVNTDEWRWISIDTSLWTGLRAYIEVLHNGDEMGFVTLQPHSAKHADDGYVAIDRAHLVLLSKVVWS